jgi:hypothetical protein
MKINYKNIQCLVAFLIFSFSFITCSKKEDRNLNKDKFVEIYSEIVLISANNSYTDPERKTKIDSLFTAHQTSEKAFNNTVEDFNKNPEDWKEIYKQVLERIESKRDKNKIEIK